MTVTLRWIILIFVISFTILQFFSWQIFQESLNPQAVPLIVLKLPRSGSSWYSQILNEFPTVFLSKEIIQKHDSVFKASESEVIVQHLIKALKTPTDKFSSRKNFIPSGRFFEDYIGRWKYLLTLQVVGFSLNPEHLDLNILSKLLKAVPKTKVVVLERINYVKSALSDLRGKQVCK